MGLIEPNHCTFQWGLLIISLLHHERNPAASQLGSARVPTTLPLHIPAHPLWETPYRQGLHLSTPPPIHPSYLQPPKLWGPQSSASSRRSIVCVGSSSARLLSGPAPQHVLYAHADDTAALQPGSSGIKRNNALPKIVHIHSEWRCK